MKTEDYGELYRKLLAQELKKQVENYKKLGFKHLQDKNNNLKTQLEKIKSILCEKIN